MRDPPEAPPALPEADYIANTVTLWRSWAELSSAGTTVDPGRAVMLSPQNLSVNGEDIDCEKYNIDGSNFFQLRELGDALGFEVDYDAVTNTTVVRSAAA